MNRLLIVLTVLLAAGCTAGTDTPEVHYERGNILSDRGQYEEAIPLYTKALEALPDWPVIYFRRGLCYEALELNERALADYSACLELDAVYPDAINNKGVVLAKLGQFAEAAEQFSSILAQDSSNVLALRNRGLCYHDQGELDLALADYSAAIKIAPDDVQSWFQRGNVYLEQDDFKKALEDFSHAVEVDPEFPKARVNKGVALYNLGQREAAMEEFREARSLDDGIIIPDIDWVNVDAVAEVAPVTEVTLAKPVLDDAAHLPPITVLVDFARSFLTEQGYQNPEPAQQIAAQHCFKFIASKTDGGEDVAIYVSYHHNDKGQRITIPAVSEDSARALLVLKPKSDETRQPAVDRFVPDWKPTDADLQPLSVTFELPQN